MPLLPRVAAGEAGAVEAVLDRYGSTIWSMARRIYIDAGEAEDAAQDVFVELWRHASRYDADAAGEWTFVMTVARRRLIDRLRRTKRRREAMDDLAHQQHTRDDATDDPLELTQLQDDATQAVEAMQSLSREQRRVIRMSIFDGKSYPEIAEALGMPLGTIKTHARRGLIRLREQLGDADEA